MTGRKNGAFVEDLQLAKIKAFCKQRGCTVNDYISAVMSNSFYEYFERHQEEDGKIFTRPTKVQLGMPVSMRQPMVHIEDVRMTNEMIAFPAVIPVLKSMDEALPPIMAYFKKLRRSIRIYGEYKLVNMSMHSIFTIPRLIVEIVTLHYTGIFSNIHASKSEYVINGKKHFGQFYFVPSVGKMCTGFSMITVGPYMSMACFADENSIKNP